MCGHYRLSDESRLSDLGPFAVTIVQRCSGNRYAGFLSRAPSKNWKSETASCPDYFRVPDQVRPTFVMPAIRSECRRCRSVARRTSVETPHGLAIRAPQPHNQRTAGHEWRDALEPSAQSSWCMGRKLFLYTALPIALPRRSPAT
jgi:hypothetical protein